MREAVPFWHCDNAYWIFLSTTSSSSSSNVYAYGEAIISIKNLPCHTQHAFFSYPNSAQFPFMFMSLSFSSIIAFYCILAGTLQRVASPGGIVRHICFGWQNTAGQLLLFVCLYVHSLFFSSMKCTIISLFAFFT